MKRSVVLLSVTFLSIYMNGCKGTWYSTTDYKVLLEESSPYTYEAIGKFMPILNISSVRSLAETDLDLLRAAYRLRDIVGTGSQEVQAIRLMKWVHDSVKHKGSAPYRGPNYRPGMLAYGLRTKEGVHCDIQAQIMETVFEAAGFPARRVLCFPKDETKDFHSLTEAYLSEYDSWVCFDPTNETVFRDEKEKLLSIQEIRTRLTLKLPLYPSPEVNWNGKARDMEQYINYIAKNLYQLCMHIPLGTSYIGIELDPNYREGQTNPRVNNAGILVYTTGNPDYFWYP